MDKDLTALTGLKAAEVSLVKRGANLKKRFPVFKEKGEREMDEIIKTVLESETDNEAALIDFMKAAKISEKGMTAARGALRILNAFKEEIPSDVIRKLEDLAGYKKPEDQYPEPGKKAAACGEKDKVKKGDDGENKPELPPEVQAILKQQSDELTAVKKEAADATAALKTERDARELQGWVEKARNELSHFPGKSAEDLGRVLKSLHDVNPELAKEQFEQMKTASETIKKSALISEAGTFGSAGNGAGSAWDQIQKMADAMIQKSEDVHMTKAKAVSKVMELRPDLYQRYLEEHPQQSTP